MSWKNDACVSFQSYVYECHSQMIDNLLGVLDTGRNKTFCSWQSKEGRLNWKKERESRSAVSTHGDRGGSGLGYGRQQVPTALI